MKKPAVISCLLAILLAACQPQNEKIDFRALEEFFTGEWTLINEDVLMTESWAPAGILHLQGITLASRDRDTLLYEELSIVQTDTGIFYIARVQGENDGQAIAFRLISLQPDSITFINPAHDFPQRIVYCKPDDNRLEAILTGRGKTGPRTITLHFSKTPEVDETR